MALRVFTPAQAKSAVEERTAKDTFRAREVLEATHELLQMRAEAERDFEDALKAQREISERNFNETVERKNELEKEVSRLEARRKEALRPLLIKEEDIQSVQDALKAQGLEIEKKESEFEEERRLLMRKLDEAAHKLQELEKREKRIVGQEQGTEFQRNQVANDSRRLNERLAEFQQSIEEKEQAFAFRQSELDAQKNLYDEKDKLLVEREQEIEAGKRLIRDQRILLEKGFFELQTKQNKK